MLLLTIQLAMRELRANLMRSVLTTLGIVVGVYRKLSFAMVPLAPALIRSRLKQGKEDPDRVGERRLEPRRGGDVLDHPTARADQVVVMTRELFGELEP